MMKQGRPIPPTGSGRHWLVWVACFFLTLCLHILLFQIRWKVSSPRKDPPIALKTLSPEQFSAIRKKWKRNTFLLSKEAPPKGEAKPAPNARYVTDRNIRVKKEQRASNTDINPRPGTTATIAPPSHKRSRQALPKLGNLAIPFKLDPNPPARVTPWNKEAASFRDQAIEDDRDLPLGAENMLNTRESIYYSFYARLYQVISPLWLNLARSAISKVKTAPGEYVTIVDVTLDENGNLLGIRRLQSAGIPELDRAVEETWEKVSRFPNPPRGLLDAQKQAHIPWKYTMKVGHGFNIDYMPPPRFRQF